MRSFAQRRRCLKLLAISLAMALAWGGWFDAGDAAGAENSQAGLDAQIAGWITDLGSPQYVQRERAQQELQRVGLAAFDSLLEAQRHDDVEIAARSRYLLRSLRISWSDQGDAAEVKSILRNYDQFNRDDRRNCMRQLATLDGSQGVAALCRLARFDIDPVLSKQAALLAMGRGVPADAEPRAKLAETIRTTITGSRRTAGVWLLAYARSLEDLASAISELERISSAEAELLARFPEESDRTVLRDLLRWRSEMLLKLDRKEDALVVLRQAMALMGSDRSEIYDMLDWALQNNVWALGDELASRFQDQFRADPLLMYRWAESQRNSGRGELAEQTAKAALEMDSDRSERHVETARQLIERLDYDWAERELRRVIASIQPEDETSMEAMFFLSDLLFDLKKEQEAALVLQDAVDAIDKNSKILQNFSRSVGAVRSLMHFRFAEHCAKTGDVQGQRKHLEEAVRQNPADIDVLISMYRMKGADADWKRGTSERIRSVGGRLRDGARQYEEMAQNPANQRLRSDVAATLAMQLNQYAWLVCNTEGDFRDALRASRRSLELSPDNSAYFDTQARCHYALGDLENAVRCQTRAAQLEASSQQIVRQLEIYRKELTDKRKSSASGGAGN